MKQNYIMCLIGILTVYNVAFSMNKDPQEVIAEFRKYYVEAQKLPKDSQEAMVAYGQAADIILPAPSRYFADTYKTERDNQKEAKNKIKEYVEWEEDDKQLKAYKKYAPVAFAKEIIELEKKINEPAEAETPESALKTAKDLLAKGDFEGAAKKVTPLTISDDPKIKKQAQDLLQEIDNKTRITEFNKWYNSAQDLENAGQNDEAMKLYGKIVSVELPKQTSMFSDPYSKERKKQQEAKENIKTYVDALKTPEKKLQKYTEYTELAPGAFADEITKLEQAILAQKTGPEKSDLTEAQALLDKNNLEEARDKATPYLKSSDEQVKNVAQSVLTQIDAKEQKTPEKPSIIQVQNGKAIVIQMQNLAHTLNQFKLKIVSKS